MQFVNNEILEKSFLLLDLGISATSNADGNLAMAYVIYDIQRIIKDQEKKLYIIKERHDGSWGNSFDFVNKTIKNLGSKFFKHGFSARQFDDNNLQWVCIWHWANAKEVIQSADIQLNQFRINDWSKLISEAEQFYKLQMSGRRPIDVKIGCGAIYNQDSLLNIVSVKDTNCNGLIELGFQNYEGKYDEILNTLEKKIQKIPQIEFISSSICPINYFKKSEKATICVRFRDSSAGKFHSLERKWECIKSFGKSNDKITFQLEVKQGLSYKSKQGQTLTVELNVGSNFYQMVNETQGISENVKQELLQNYQTLEEKIINIENQSALNGLAFWQYIWDAENSYGKARMRFSKIAQTESYQIYPQ